MQRGITLPLTQVEFGILCAMVVLGGLIGWWFWAARLESRTKGRDRSTSEHLLEIFSWLLAPVWAALVLFTLYNIWLTSQDLLVTGEGEVARWIGLRFGGLVTGLIALVSAPLALIRVATTERQTRTAEQGHMTDRISKAVEQLGTEKTVKKIVTGHKGRPTTQETSEPNLEVRIGGLLSLERIAQDSTTYDKGRDHVRVMEIICAYIRNNAPAKDATDFPPGDLEPLTDDATSELRKERADKLRAWAQTLEGPREDIMHALRILERRSDKQRRIEAAHGQKGITETDWVFSDPAPEPFEPPEGQVYPKSAVAEFKEHLRAWKEKLAGYQGYRPDLRHTCLQHADLSGFRLSGVRLDGARLDGARLDGADLRGALLDGADLRGARLDGADLRGALLDGAKLREARLDGAKLREARLDGAKLREALLDGAKLREALLDGADLRGARMDGADLRGARLDANTDLRAADFSGSALRSVDYQTVAISQDQVNASFGDSSVILPDGIVRPAHWPDWEVADPDIFGNGISVWFDTEWRRWRENPEAYTPPPAPAG